MTRGKWDTCAWEHILYQLTLPEDQGKVGHMYMISHITVSYLYHLALPEDQRKVGQYVHEITSYVSFVLPDDQGKVGYIYVHDMK